MAFFFGGTFWMLLDVKATKGIDASFVSAVMDTIMATVAILALLKAKQIWDDKGKDVGHQYVMKLLTEVVPVLNVSPSTSMLLTFIEANVLNIYTMPTKMTAEKIAMSIDVKKICIKQCFDEVNKLREYSIYEMDRIVNSCDDLISQISMCGITVKQGFVGACLERQIKQYRDYTFGLSQLCWDLESTFQLFKSETIFEIDSKNYPDMKSFMSVLDENKLKECITRINDLKIIEKDIKVNVQNIIKGGYKPTDYFDFNS